MGRPLLHRKSLAGTLVVFLVALFIVLSEIGRMADWLQGGLLAAAFLVPAIVARFRRLTAPPRVKPVIPAASDPAPE